MERATVYLETKPTLGWSRSTGRRMPEGVVELAWRGTTPVAAVQLSTIMNLALRTSYLFPASVDRRMQVRWGGGTG